MPIDRDEMERRRTTALNAFKQVFGTPGDEHAVTLFVSHHLDELGGEYWQEHCGAPRPEPKQVLDILTLRSHWGEGGEEDEDGIDVFDFSLPGDVSNYVISVSFDQNGDVEDITMES